MASTYRTCYRDMLCRNVVLKNFTRFTGKKLPWKYLQPTTILVKNFHGSYFKINFVKLFTKTSSQNTSVQRLKNFSLAKESSFLFILYHILKKEFSYLKRPDLNYHLKVYSLFIYEVV